MTRGKSKKMKGEVKDEENNRNSINNYIANSDRSDYVLFENTKTTRTQENNS